MYCVVSYGAAERVASIQISDLDDDRLVSGCLQKGFKSSNGDAGRGLVGQRVKVQIRIFAVNLVAPQLAIEYERNTMLPGVV